MENINAIDRFTLAFEATEREGMAAQLYAYGVQENQLNDIKDFKFDLRYPLQMTKTAIQYLLMKSKEWKDMADVSISTPHSAGILQAFGDSLKIKRTSNPEVLVIPKETLIQQRNSKDETTQVPSPVG